MNLIEPTYLRYVHGNLEKGTLNAENAAALPYGFIGLYEETFQSNIPISNRQSTLKRLAIWALFKGGVSSYLASQILVESQEDTKSLIDSFSSWFNTKDSNKYILYHDRLRSYLLQKLSSHELQVLNEQIISHLESSIEAQKEDEAEIYALEHLGTHMATESQMDSNYERLHDFANQEALWPRQVSISKEYKWSQQAVQYSIKEGARRHNEMNTLSSTVNSIKLMQDEENAIEQIFNYLKEKEIVLVLNRLESLESSKRLKLSILLIQDLTIGELNHLEFKKEACFEIISSIDQIKDNSIDWTLFYSIEFIYLIYLELKKMNLDASSIFKRGNFTLNSIFVSNINMVKDQIDIKEINFEDISYINQFNSNLQDKIETNFKIIEHHFNKKNSFINDYKLKYDDEFETEFIYLEGDEVIDQTISLINNLESLIEQNEYRIKLAKKLYEQSSIRCEAMKVSSNHFVTGFHITINNLINYVKSLPKYFDRLDKLKEFSYELSIFYAIKEIENKILEFAIDDLKKANIHHNSLSFAHNEIAKIAINFSYYETGFNFVNKGFLGVKEIINKHQEELKINDLEFESKYTFWEMCEMSISKLSGKINYEYSRQNFGDFIKLYETLLDLYVNLLSKNKKSIITEIKVLMNDILNTYNETFLENDHDKIKNSYVLNNLVDEKIFSWAKKGSFKKIELLSKNLDYPFIDLNDIMYVSLRIYINSSSFKDEEYQNILNETFSNFNYIDLKSFCFKLINHDKAYEKAISISNNLFTIDQKIRFYVYTINTLIDEKNFKYILRYFDEFDILLNTEFINQNKIQNSELTNLLNKLFNSIKTFNHSDILNLLKLLNAEHINLNYDKTKLIDELKSYIPSKLKDAEKYANYENETYVDIIYKLWVEGEFFDLIGYYTTCKDCKEDLIYYKNEEVETKKYEYQNIFEKSQSELANKILNINSYDRKFEMEYDEIEDLESNLEHADELYSLGLLEEAKELKYSTPTFENIANGTDEWFFELAILEAKNGDYDSAVKNFNKIDFDIIKDLTLYYISKVFITKNQIDKSLLNYNLVKHDYFKSLILLDISFYYEKTDKRHIDYLNKCLSIANSLKIKWRKDSILSKICFKLLEYERETDIIKFKKELTINAYKLLVDFQLQKNNFLEEGENSKLCLDFKEKVESIDLQYDTNLVENFDELFSKKEPIITTESELNELIDEMDIYSFGYMDVVIKIRTLVNYYKENNHENLIRIILKRFKPYKNHMDSFDEINWQNIKLLLAEIYLSLDEKTKFKRIKNHF